jgi:hypothetical protein
MPVLVRCATLAGINSPETLVMRTASFIAATIIAIGIYLLVASAVALPGAWIGLGMLGIGFVGAAGIVAANPAPSAR